MTVASLAMIIVLTCKIFAGINNSAFEFAKISQKYSTICRISEFTDPVDGRDEGDAAGAGDVAVVEAHAARRAQLQHFRALCHPDRTLRWLAGTEQALSNSIESTWWRD